MTKSTGGYRVDRILTGGQPAIRTPEPKKIVTKPKVAKSPAEANALHNAMQANSRRIVLLKTLDIYLRHNTQQIDEAEKFVAELTKVSGS